MSSATIARKVERINQICDERNQVCRPGSPTRGLPSGEHEVRVSGISRGSLGSKRKEKPGPNRDQRPSKIETVRF